MSRKYRISFVVEGDMVAEDVTLNKESIKLGVLNTFDTEHGQSYWGNRDIDSEVTDLKIERVYKAKGN